MQLKLLRPSSNARTAVCSCNGRGRSSTIALLELLKASTRLLRLVCHVQQGCLRSDALVDSLEGW